jgi:predicted MFS family arabinose efflux permease
MSLLLLIGLVLAGVPAALIVGFAAYIFIGFVTDDKDAKAVFYLALIIMGIGIALILAHVAGTIIQITP